MPEVKIGWDNLTQGLLSDLKRGSTIPSVELFMHRMNLYRREPDSSEIIDMLIQEKDNVLAQITRDEELRDREKNKM